MFAKSTRIGLVSLFVVAATALGGCAETVGSEPVSFPSEHRSVAFLSRSPLYPQMSEERAQAPKLDSVARIDSESKHHAHPVANAH